MRIAIVLQENFIIEPYSSRGKFISMCHRWITSSRPSSSHGTGLSLLLSTIIPFWVQIDNRIAIQVSIMQEASHPHVLVGGDTKGNQVPSSEGGLNLA
ncbi:hypothetical protein Mp_1g03610 [Marchantia polymorpha subsp. ruderalis]|uniref:Uncharacterized protein n=2 Tax=Marchantia polymorpha TaxID=3197 RepID=A0AAF6AL59_MARPO|nr:hypothetical protein MARPO_0005s0247 [Marchantia polymorpha]BBM97179.1 hypothetical protein Mp_1g03610 [Marchantia polymorpha subsp. ruderalis]|eukprot:PTQ48628.1 hypothetical protein MARPO_0005s0247 [Marchantia polymorpha]